MDEVYPSRSRTTRARAVCAYVLIFIVLLGRCCTGFRNPCFQSTYAIFAPKSSIRNSTPTLNPEDFAFFSFQ